MCLLACRRIPPRCSLAGFIWWKLRDVLDALECVRGPIRLENREVSFQAAEQLPSTFSLQSRLDALGTGCYQLMPCPLSTHPVSRVRNANAQGTQDNLQITLHLDRTAAMTKPWTPHFKPVRKSFAAACEDIDIDARTHPLLADIGILSSPRYSCTLSGLQQSAGICKESFDRHVYHAASWAGRTRTSISAAVFPTCRPLARRAWEQLG